MFIGQPVIQAQLQNLTLDNMPQTLLLEGPRGCGKRTLIKEISKKLNLPAVDISNLISFDFFCTIYDNLTISLYTIDADVLSIRQQNILLKLLEEPPKSTFIILYTTHRSALLKTLTSRCTCWEFSPYSIEELKTYAETHNMQYNELARTFGDLVYLQGVSIEDIRNLANLLLDKIGVASFPNTLSVSTRLAFKGENDKIDVEIFNQIFLQEASKRFQGTEVSDADVNKFKIILDYLHAYKQPGNSDRQRLFENCLTNLWLNSRGL